MKDLVLGSNTRNLELGKVNVGQHYVGLWGSIGWACLNLDQSCDSDHDVRVARSTEGYRAHPLTDRVSTDSPLFEREGKGGSSVLPSCGGFSFNPSYGGDWRRSPSLPLGGVQRDGELQLKCGVQL